MIEGKLVKMRLIKKDDLKYIREWINDPEVQYYSQESYPSYYTTWHIKKIYEQGIKGKMYIFIIEEKNGRVIGEVWLYPIDTVRKIAELVIVIGRKDLRGKGYGKDVINAIKDFGFNRLNLESIYLKVFSFNLRGINCYKACGFQTIGRIPNKVVRDGVSYDELVMEVRKGR